MSRDDNFRFTEVSSDCGVDFVFRTNTQAEQYTILESLGGGLGLFDFDGDSSLDICFAGGGEVTPTSEIKGAPIQLYHNRGGFQFEDVTFQSKARSSELYSHGIAAADFDNDGFSDFLLTGYGGIQLWKNLGDGTFTELGRQAGLTSESWSSSAAWGDLDRDGNLDLYVANYVDWSFANNPQCGTEPDQRDRCPPKRFNALSDIAYYSDGAGRFTNETANVGFRFEGKGLGVMLADVDTDNDLDVYVANDTTSNFLYINDGTGRAFNEMAAVSGVAVGARGTPDGSMGISLCDFNNDCQADVVVTNYEAEGIALYRNEGNAQFFHVSQAVGLTALQGLFVGFGTACQDFDHDGDDDIIVANGHVILHPYLSPRRQLPLLLQNDSGRFRRAQPRGYFSVPREGRGLAVGDIDNDGDFDVVISHVTDPAGTLRNDGLDGTWCGVRLVGRKSNREAIGSHVRFETSNSIIVRQVVGGGSYLSTSDRRVLVRIPKDQTLSNISIIWPNGDQQMLSGPPTNEFVIVVQPNENGT